MRILLDSTVLIDLERKNEDAVDLLKSMLANNEEVIISTVTIAEVLTGVYHLGRREGVLDAKAVLAQFLPVPLNSEVADKTAQFVAFLLKSGSPVDFKDVAIAATFAATKSDFLITQNKKHFEIIPEIGNKARTISEFRKIYA